MATSAFDELAKLGAVISDANRRKQFANDPDGTLRAVGINPALIPADVLETLSGLSAAELRVLASVKQSLKNDNVPDHIRSEIV